MNINQYHDLKIVASSNQQTKGTIIQNVIITSKNATNLLDVIISIILINTNQTLFGIIALYCVIMVELLYIKSNIVSAHL